MVLETMKDRKAVSVSNELQLLIGVADALRRITEGLAESRFHDERLPSAIAACMTIFRERLRLLDQVVRGGTDPRSMWCEENEAIVIVPGDLREDEDVVLKAWSDRRTARHHRRAWKMAKRMLKRKREGRS